jgi:EAL and modified HD-GYP domain-containing signal transduction protein
MNSLWQKQAPPARAQPAGAALAAPEAAKAPVKCSDEERRFIARQTIFDRSRGVYGYELLCRSGWENSFSGDSEKATRQMIADGALYGFQELTHGALSFVNCTRESLVSETVTLLPTTTVLEILETVEADPEVLEACGRLKRMGYKLALDDFQLRDGMEELIELADYIKVDFRLSDAAERQAIIESLQGRKLTLVAEKVETEAEFQDALAEGFTLFQGYFFCRPTVFSKKCAPGNGANYLFLLAALSKPEIHFSQLALLLQSEVTLAYQLLRLVNSASFGMGRTIGSLQDALIAVGEHQFCKLILNAIATETCRTRTSGLLIHVLHRSRFLEMAARFTGEDAAEQYLFGMLSLMDVMLDVPSLEFIEEMPLRQEMKDALCGAQNPFSIALRLHDAYNTGNWALCAEIGMELGATEREVSDMYRESLLWAEECEQQSRNRPPSFE